MKPFKIGMAEIDGLAAIIIEQDGAVRRLPTDPELFPSRLDEVCADWDGWFPRLAALTESSPFTAWTALEVTSIKWLPPLRAPASLICIGANYWDHINEMKVPTAPRFPYAFLRPRSCLNANGAAVQLPKLSKMVDWEAELGVVIGRRVRNVTGDAAMEAVAAYTVVNDISARDWIEDRPAIGIDWVMQKAWNGFQPTGPWLTPAAFVPDPQNLPIRCLVNGITKQHSNTSQMIFGVRQIVEHLSAIMTLEPGDIIATGTPAGVGFARQPREFLSAGDVVEVTVAGLGTLTNRMTSVEGSRE